jgi:hypothetical protein
MMRILLGAALGAGGAYYGISYFNPNVAQGLGYE